MAAVTIDINIFWDRDEPDGSECCNRGDGCYLAMWRMFVSAGKLASRVETVNVMCESCHNAMMESEAAND